MGEKHLYEYAVIRVVPRVERQEFLNIGVILYCKEEKFLDVLYQINEGRLNAFGEDVGFGLLMEAFKAYRDIARGVTLAGPIAQLPIAERFRWLTAIRSTIIQSSAVHSGFCADAPAELIKLQQQLVL